MDCHIGSQLTEISPFIDALKRLLKLVDKLAEQGIVLHHLDLGGGLGVCYKDEEPPSIGDSIAAVRRELGDRPFIHGLRRFYQDNRFRPAGYPELQRAFEIAILVTKGVLLPGNIETGRHYQ